MGKNWPKPAGNVTLVNAAAAGTRAKVVTRRASIKRPRDSDTGHVIVGVGFAFECSCGKRGKNRPTYRAAMQEGRDHARGHEHA